MGGKWRPGAKDNCMSPRPNQKLARSLLVYCALLVAYFGWAWERVGHYVLVKDQKWPRPFPYPDQWLWALNNYFDAKYPARPGEIKLHAEIDRVRLVLLIALGSLTLIWLTSAVAVFWDVAHITKETQARRLLLLLLSVSPLFAFMCEFPVPGTSGIFAARVLICLAVTVGIWLGALALRSRSLSAHTNDGHS
jgi:hypothetical protein